MCSNCFQNIEIAASLKTSPQIVRWISTLVARRSAILGGACLAAILIQTDYATLKGEKIPTKGLNDRLDVGVDGR